MKDWTNEIEENASDVKKETAWIVKEMVKWVRSIKIRVNAKAIRELNRDMRSFLAETAQSIELKMPMAIRSAAYKDSPAIFRMKCESGSITGFWENDTGHFYPIDLAPSMPLYMSVLPSEWARLILKGIFEGRNLLPGFKIISRTKDHASGMEIARFRWIPPVVDFKKLKHKSVI